jgi:hypothetical protein
MKTKASEPRFPSRPKHKRESHAIDPGEHHASNPPACPLDWERLSSKPIEWAKEECCVLESQREGSVQRGVTAEEKLVEWRLWVSLQVEVEKGSCGRATECWECMVRGRCM